MMIVLFGNITTTMKVKKMLSEKGIISEAVQTVRNPDKPDCGHGLKLDKKYFEDIKETSAILNAKIKGVFYE